MSPSRPKAVHKRRAPEVQWWILQAAVRPQISGQICGATYRKTVHLQRYQSKWTFSLGLMYCHIYSKHLVLWAFAHKSRVNRELLVSDGNWKGYNCFDKQKCVRVEPTQLQPNLPKTRLYLFHLPGDVSVSGFQFFKLSRKIKHTDSPHFFQKRKECSIWFREDQQGLSSLEDFSSRHISAAETWDS